MSYLNTAFDYLQWQHKEKDETRILRVVTSIGSCAKEEYNQFWYVTFKGKVWFMSYEPIEYWAAALTGITYVGTGLRRPTIHISDVHQSSTNKYAHLNQMFD